MKKTSSTLALSLFVSAVTNGAAPNVAFAKEKKATSVSTSKRMPANASKTEIAKAEALMREELRLAAALSVVDEGYAQQIKEKLKEAIQNGRKSSDRLNNSGNVLMTSGGGIAMMGLMLSAAMSQGGETEGMNSVGGAIVVGGVLALVGLSMTGSADSSAGKGGKNKINQQELNSKLQQNVDDVSELFGYIFSLDESKKVRLKSVILNAAFAAAQEDKNVDLGEILRKEVGTDSNHLRAVEVVLDAIKFGTLESGGSNIASLNPQERKELATKVIKEQTNWIDEKVTDLIKNRQDYQSRGINAEQMKSNLVNIQKKLIWVSQNL